MHHDFNFEFQVREGMSLTSCTGVITKILPNSGVKIPGFNVTVVKKKTAPKK
jgi:hypothetical protein